MGLLRLSRSAITAAACAALALSVHTRTAHAQSGKPATTLVEPPAPLLPATAQLVPGLNGVSKAPPSAESQAVLAEDGLKREETSTVMVAGKDGAIPKAWVTAYEFTDATGAFAAYTFLRSGGRPISNGINSTETRIDGGGVIFLSGTAVVVVNTRFYPDSEAALLKTIDAGLPKVGGRRGLAPLLPTLLPAAGLDAGSIRYALGPVGYKAMGGVLPAGDLGWDKSAEVATAGYHGGKGLLTLLLYPTPQIAGDRGRVIQNDVNAAGPASFGTIKMRRLGPLVGVTSGGLSDAQAIDLVSHMKLNEEVTFDKPMPLEFHAEIRKTYTLLQEISTFCGIAVLAALVLGVFLGGARAGIRVLQGKSAASDPEFLRIDLRGKAPGNLDPPDKA